MNAKVKAYRDGLLAETLAALLFRLRGYRVVAQRYRSPVGEIDLVASRGRHLVFVEVKRRKTKDEAAYSLSTRQQERIARAAQYWLASHPDFTGHTVRFDVVLAAPWSWPRHIENAFAV